MNQIEKILDECKTNLIYPYHINHKLKTNKYNYNEKYDAFHAHNFNDIILRVNENKKAFYLTDEDMEYYSKQEIDLINKIKMLT